MKPTPIPIGDSISYYRLILRGLLYIWTPLAVVFIGVPIVVVTIVYLIGLFTNHRGNLSDFALSPLAVVLLIVGAIAVGSLCTCRTALSPPLSRTTCTSTSGIFTAPRRALATPRTPTASAWRLKPTPTSCSSVSRSSLTSSAENMYMAGIQEIDEYPRVLSDSVMLPRNYRVAETTEGEDRIDRFVNWVRSKIGFERLEPRIIYRLEHKDAHKDAKKESAHGEPVATEQGVSEQPVETLAQDKQEDAQKAPEAPASAESASDEPIVAEVSVEAPAEVPAENLAEVPVEDAPTEPVIGGATDSSAAAGADDPTEAFTRIPHDAASHEKSGDDKAAGEKPKN